MFIDEFATQNGYTLVYHDEDPNGRRYTFGILHDKRKSQYYVCTFASGAYGLKSEDIEKRVFPVTTSEDIRKLGGTISPFINSTVDIFANFCEGEKSIGDAFNKLREPLLTLAKVKKDSVDKARRMNQQDPQLPFSLSSKETLFPEKTWSLGRFQFNVMPKEIYHQSHYFQFNLPKVVYPKRKATSETNFLKVTIWDGKTLVPQFTSANLLYFLNDLRKQYNYNHTFKGRVKRLLSKIKTLAH